MTQKEEMNVLKKEIKDLKKELNQIKKQPAHMHIHYHNDPYPGQIVVPPGMEFGDDLFPPNIAC